MKNLLIMLKLNALETQTKMMRMKESGKKLISS